MPRAGGVARTASAHLLGELLDDLFFALAFRDRIADLIAHGVS